MALTKDYTLNGDFTISSAYLRIKEILIEYDPIKAGELSVGLKFIARPRIEVRPTKGKNKLEEWQSTQWVFAYDHTSNVNAIKQAYTYLKTLPEFSGATDSNE